MPIVEREAYLTLSAAVRKPDSFNSGAPRKKLQAAFDITWSQIIKYVLGQELPNRMMARSVLNTTPAENIPTSYQPLMRQLNTALASAEALYAKGYEESAEATVEFIEDSLGPLIKCIDAIGNG